MYTNDWQSIHIFIHDFSEHDRFIKNYLSPYVQSSKNIHRYFFIRYWQGGPHIRFRFQGIDPRKTYAEIESLLLIYKKQYHSTFSLSPDMFYANHKFDGQQPDEDELYWMDNFTAHIIPYYPEENRYGTVEQLALNEKLFEYSSELAISLMHLLPENHLLLKLIVSCYLFRLLEGFLESKQHESISELYEQFWAFQKNPLVDYEEICKKLIVLHEKFCENGLLLNFINNHVQAFEVVLIKLNKITNPVFFRYMMMSQIHMFNNRIGLPPEFEHLLGGKLTAKERSNAVVFQPK